MVKKTGKKVKETELITRTLPHNIEAEKACLAAILLDDTPPTIFDEVYSQINIDSFYYIPHQKIFKAIISLRKKSLPLDIVPLTDILKHDDVFSEIGVEEYLIELLNCIATPANYLYYTKIVKDKSILSHLINVSTEIIQEAYNEEEDVVEVLDNAERKIFDISRKRTESAFVSIEDALHDVFEQLDTIQMLTDKKILGIPTGFDHLDKLLSGLQNSNFIIFAGRPSMGKTAFALNVAANVALRNNFGVGIFSLEMPFQQLALRLLCSEGRVNSQLAFSGSLSKKEYARLIDVASRFMKVPIWIYDKPNLTLFELKAAARRMKDKFDIKLLIVDYIQLLKGSRTFRAESRQTEMSEISRELKSLARELEIPLIGISQLSRAVEQRTEDNRPRLSDLRETGALEQDADIVAFLYRGEYYRTRKERQKHAGIHTDDYGDGQTDKHGGDEIIVRKNRNGPIGTVLLKFIKEYTRFEELSIQDEENG
ncbi:replicative DNA helicase [Candidatus Dependentiae bacterium]|nr:replicative DNA helicase [Candidatus Dependentiae bacterium]